MSKKILHTWTSRNVKGALSYRLVLRNGRPRTEYFSLFEGGQWTETGDAFVADEMAELVRQLGEQGDGGKP